MHLDALDLDKSCLNTDLKKSCGEKIFMKQLGNVNTDWICEDIKELLIF